MDPWWLALLREQQREGFADLAGARASITMPIADRLVSRIIAQHVIPRAPIREFDLAAHAGDVLAIRVRLAKPAFVPPIWLRLAIEQQPVLPSSPFLVLGVQSSGLAALFAGALRFVDLLPPGVTFDGQRFTIDLAAILERQQAADVLAYFSSLRLTTTDGQLVLQAELALPPPG